METLNATYKNGVLVILDKVNPEKLKSKKVQIRIIDEVNHKKIQKNKLKRVYNYLHQSNPFSEIKDVIKWQKKVRADRELFS